MNQTAPDNPNATDAAAAPRRPLWRRVTRRVLWSVAALVGFIVVLVVGVLLFLQTSWGANYAAGWALGRFNPFVEARLEAGNVDGNFITGLRLTDVRLVTDDGDTLARIDTLAVRHGLRSLLDRTLQFHALDVVNPVITMTQQPDSTWDLLNVMPVSEDTAATTFQIVFEQMRLSEGEVTAHFYAPGRDSLLRVDGLNVRLSDTRFGRGGLKLGLDTLNAVLTRPDRVAPVTLALGADLAGGQLAVRGLRLVSDRSSVAGAGTMGLPGSAVDSLDFTLTAAPLAFDDLYPFVPALDRTASVTLDLRLGGTLAQTDLALDATFSDGGSLSVQGAGRLPSDDGLRVALTGEIRRLDPALFSTLQGRINADFAADLTGAELAALDGTARVRLFDTRLAEDRFERATLAVTFDEGRANLDFDGGFRGTALALQGQLDPFAETPTYDLRGSFARLDLGKMTGNPAQESNVGGSFRLTGAGFDPATADLTARLEVAPSEINGYTLLGGKLTASLDGGRLGFDTELRLPEGGISARGGATFGEEIAYRIDQARLDNLRLGALLGDTTASVLNGDLRLTGRGTDPATLSLTGTLNLRDSFYGTYGINAADVDLALRGGRLTLGTKADLRGGAVQFEAIARPFDANPTFTVNNGAFQNVDLGELLSRPDLSSDLGGRVTLAGRGFDPATLRLDARLELDASVLNQQTINAATLTATMESGTLDFDGTLDLPEGRTQLAGTVNPMAETPTYALRTGNFSGLNVGALLGLPEWQTDLNGSIVLNGSGFDPATLALDARLNFTASQVNGETIRDGYAEVELRDGLTRLGSELQFSEGEARITATGRFFDETPTYEAQGVLDRVDWARLSGNDTLRANVSGSFEVRGAGFDPETMTLDAELRLDDTTYEDIAIQGGFVSLRLADGTAQVDSLSLQSNLGLITGKGPLALFDPDGTRPSEFSFDLSTDQLEALGPLIGAELLSLGEGRVTGRIFGRPGQMRFDVRADVSSLVYNDIRLAGFNGRAVGELSKDRSVQLAEVRVRMDFFSVPTFSVERTELTASYTPEEASFNTTFRVDGRRDGRIAARVDLRPENQVVVLDSLLLRFDEERWELLQEATISYGEEYRIRNLLLFTGNQQIALDGVVDFDGEQSLILTIEQFQLGAIADLFGYNGLGGVLNGTLLLDGPAQSPLVDGTLDFDLTLHDDPLGDMQMTLGYGDLMLLLDARLSHVAGGMLTLGGTYPLDLRLSTPDETEAAVPVATETVAGAVDLRLKADTFDINWLLPFLDPTTIDRLDGQFRADVHVGGTIDAPELSGEAFLSQGRIGIPALGTPKRSHRYEDIELDVEFTGNQILLKHLELHAGGGSLIGEGTIDLAQLNLGEFDLQMSAENFLAINSDAYRAVAVADLALRGTTEAPVLSGNVRLRSADIRLTEEATSAEFEPVQLTEADQRTLEQRFGVRLAEDDTTTFDFYNALTIANLQVALERDVWLRSKKNPAMDIQFTGSLDVSKQPNTPDPNVFGSITVIPDRSRIDQFGKRFTIETGTLTFNGPPTDPVINLAARYEVRARGSGENEVTITLSAEGLLEDLDVTLGSEPSMETSDVVSYLAFGRPASEALQFGGAGSSLVDPAAGVALGQITNFVENLAGSEFGLDVIEIEQNGLQGATLTAGKYVSPRVYISVSQPISFSKSTTSSEGENRTQVTLEYEVIQQLLLRLLRRGSVIRINLQWEYAY